MTIKLSPELEKFVNERVETGAYSDPEAVVADALMRLQLENMPLPENPEPLGPFDHPWTIEKLRAAIQRGIDQADRGEFSDLTAEDIISEKRQRNAKRAG